MEELDKVIKTETNDRVYRAGFLLQIFPCILLVSLST